MRGDNCNRHHAENGRPDSRGEPVSSGSCEFHADSILHDLRNMLFLIQTLATEARRVSPSSREMSLVLQELDSAVACAAEISRPEPSRQRPTKLSSLLSQTAALMRRVSPAGVHVEFACQGNDASSIVDRFTLIRVLVELCTNSLVAMPTGGSLLLSLATEHLNVETPARPKALAAGPYAVIEVCDSGDGMSPDEIEAAFQPGFSSSVEHSGLGLAIASEAIERQGGGLRVTSKAGAGTTLQILLPLQGDPGSHVVDPMPSVDAPRVQPAEEPGNVAPSSIAIIKGRQDTTVIRALIDGAALRVECFDSAEDYFHHRTEEAACVVLAIDPDVDAAALLNTLEVRDSPSSLILLYTPRQAGTLAGLGQHGALSGVPWPTSGPELHEHIHKGLARCREVMSLRDQISQLRTIFGKLTARELEVLELIRDGHSSKSIALRLHVSKRTIDDHRRALIRKTEAEAIATLVRDSSRIETLIARERQLVVGELRLRSAPGPLPSGLTPHQPLPEGAPSHPATPSPLSRLAERLQKLELSKSPACVLDRELKLIWTNPAWRRIGLAGGAEEAISHNGGVGARYTDAILPPLREWYEERLLDCMERGELWQHEYECPTPKSYRLVGLSVDRVEPGVLVLEHTVILEQPHHVSKQASRLGPTSADRLDAGQQCMACRRSRSPKAGHWTLVGEWLVVIPSGIRLALCADCEATFPGLDVNDTTPRGLEREALLPTLERL
jgi:FixJ family two-component response regulator